MGSSVGNLFSCLKKFPIILSFLIYLFPKIFSVLNEESNILKKEKDFGGATYDALKEKYREQIYPNFK